MDSKSVHRVAESLGLKRHYDAKLKLWTIGDGATAVKLTVDEVAKMHSGQMREKLYAKLKPGEAITTTGKQYVAEQKDGDTSPAQAADVKPRSDVAQAAELLKQTGGGVTAALQEHAEQVAAGKADMKQKKSKAKGAAKSGEQKKRTPPKREAGVFKIDGNVPQKPKRAPDGKLWLRSFGIHKWALRNKVKQHDGDKDTQKLLAQPTQFYSPADIKRIAKVVFDSFDRETLKDREKHTAYAIKCAESARKIAEAMLEAAS